MESLVYVLLFSIMRERRYPFVMLVFSRPPNFKEVPPPDCGEAGQMITAANEASTYSDVILQVRINQTG